MNKTKRIKIVIKSGFMTNKLGFTLIEMLVVISLIGILAAIALVSFGGSQKQARDTIRKSDMKQYQNALEAFANMANGLYPNRNTAGGTLIYQNLCNDLNTKLEPDIACIQDPKIPSDSTYYDYRYLSNGSGALGSTTATQYVLWAKIENVSATTYWFVCSTGKNSTSTSVPTLASCS
jgi:prepilin-type N-terminal cleavage/methylation domain-containing protein